LIRHVIIKVDEAWFNGFKDFDIKLLRSAETYLREGTQISKKAMEIFPDRFRNLLKSNIGTGYNNLGLVLNLLGDIEQAYKMYQIALEWNPNDNNVTRNLEAIHENAIYIHQKPLWNDVLPSSMNESFKR
jgi:tetratricopeptide (TPR) repeat protein